MSYFVQKIIEFGISQETFLQVLMLPVVATFIAFAREILGIRGFGIYITSLITFGFVATGLKYGLVIFLIVMIGATFWRFLFKKIKIHYLPRIALVLTGICLMIFFMFFCGKYFKVEGLYTLSIFPILVMILLSEHFITVQVERGLKEAVYLTLETLILAIISYFIVKSKFLANLLLNYPFWSFAFLAIVNFFLGKWTGLRVSEYLRFSKLIAFLKSQK
jgi:hypothetical protein